ncbi:bifunctional protein GlmU [Candidatus Kinetoplastibacterium blastocrithidii TCC012E]|uniref:Bifunctional protein GlmU n=1 Tax=Candidatus Kinetoplastidibacterium blastocrithidiae TCC012E TaxID=1208922 RepID=M1M2R7_9PROT|nr:bifunctional UDP-N-acetylglucosamine diphosphorylase/glucosamine-1-phosphate N-acetyltransferase GlmU [Candidatus Kinetoplastibacterium blastocrithidii]AFZ83391.1 glucosamine-1-phosphate N-acetyltransferase [Candidatus Kinetoplastibacterium blastocrithidii (ex Strigomonas culicis)]AGF49489.1 bifunctional protein GlmU [Candidatus Kinetoplastibacterium blastocrithidii TCC012E]
MLNIIILAAGSGKRMQSKIPKVLHTLAGRPMLEYVIESARNLNPNSITIVLGHEADVVKSCIDHNDLNIVLQESQLGTAHAVMCATSMISFRNNKDSTTLILYGDVPLVSVSTLRSLLDSCCGGMSILTSISDNPYGYGRIIRDNVGNIVQIVEHKEASQEQISIREINAGIIAIHTEKLKQWISMIFNNNEQKEYYLTDLVKIAVNNSVIVNSVLPKYSWEVFGINDHRQQANIERIYQYEQAKNYMLKGLTLSDPRRFDVRGSLKFGRDVFIDVGCIFEGLVELGDDVRIGPYCILRDVTVAENVLIEAYSHVSNTIVESNVVIGPFAKICKSSYIKSKSKIGNFVEIKNTSFGNSSKANHLAYIGDSEIGSNVNIGAGVVTCNYNGANKFRTIIEDNAFIGSGSQLIAPIKIGNSATIGAGTTLTDDAPADQLTIARSRQKTIVNWKRPKKN